MGYTHHDSISVTGTGGLAVGTASAGETVVVSTSGNLYAGGIQQNTAQGVIFHQFTQASTALANPCYYAAPYACNVAGYVNYSVTGGTGRLVAVSHGTGADAMALTSSSGVLQTYTLTASADTSFTAGEMMKVSFSSCATPQVAVGLTVILTKTA